MAQTPTKSLPSPSKSKHVAIANSSSSLNVNVNPLTPQSVPTRRSTRSKKPAFDYSNPHNRYDELRDHPSNKDYAAESRKEDKPLTRSNRNRNRNRTRGKRHDKDYSDSGGVSIAPVSPHQSETKKRKRVHERCVVTRAMVATNQRSEKGRKGSTLPKRRVYYKKVVYDGGEFEVGDDVYVRRREDTDSDNEFPEVEECRLCFSSGDDVMIECDDCLGGFHLKCLTPPLKEVPEGDWICGFCEARKKGKDVSFPLPPQGKKLVRTLREKLLSSHLWAAHIERYHFDNH